jgi:DNA-binding transcriptional LysR family regulator
MNIEVLRSFIAVTEAGSLNKAAERMRVAQSTVTRQMRALEDEIGGKLLERRQAGVALTAAGHTLFENVQPLLAKFDAAIAETRKRARGQSATLRIGYLLSSATEYLNPALREMRAQHPEVKVKLLDMTPGEQVAALRRAELDVAIVGNAPASLAKECFVKRIAALPVVAALPDNHPLAAKTEVALTDLRRELFVGAKDADVPGHNDWIVQLCRRARFRPRFVEQADSLSHSLSLVVAENAVTLLPAMASELETPGVVCRPLADRAARWNLLVAWQRGKPPEAVTALVAALAKNAASRAAATATARRVAG